MNTKISVIIPVYNMNKYISKCLDSIINQTLEKIEIITINDGSTDKSLEVLNEYAHKFNYIKVITQENQGQGMAKIKELLMRRANILLLWILMTFILIILAYRKCIWQRRKMMY